MSSPPTKEEDNQGSTEPIADITTFTSHQGDEKNDDETKDGETKDGETKDGETKDGETKDCGVIATFIAETETNVVEDDTEVLNRHGWEVYMAANAGNLDRLRIAESQGGNLEWENEYKHQPLMVAACNRNCLDVVNYLLSRGVNLNAVDVNGYNALHYAAREGCTEIAMALLNAGIDYTVLCNSKMTAQQYAEYYRQHDTSTSIGYFIDDRVANAVEDV